MSIEALKEQARNHELKEEWPKALSVYRQALERASDLEQPDIPLMNRVGDLLIRTGDVDGAVGQYEQAIDLYLEAELPNNAIAICKKILRNVPQRANVHLRMGQIRAGQGFLRDARQHFLFYAEEMQAKGKTDEALRALGEFAGLAPEDAEIQVMLAGQLHAQGQTDAAIQKLHLTYQTLKSKGDHEGALPVEEMLQQLAPDLPLPEFVPGRVPSAAAPEDDGLALESTSLSLDGGFGATPAAEAPPAPADPPAPAGGLEEWGDLSFDLPTEGADEEMAEEGVEVADSAAETISTPDFLGGDDLFGTEELPAVETGASGEDSFGDLDSLGSVEVGGEEDEDLGFGELPTFDLPADDEDDVEADLGADLEFATLPELDPSGETVEAPTPPEAQDQAGEVDLGGDLDLGGNLELEEVAESGGELDLGGDLALEEVADAGDDLDLGGELDLGADLDLDFGADLELAPVEDVPVEPAPTGHEELAAAGRMEEAFAAVDRALAGEPDSVPLLQRKVEYAYRLGDQRPLVSAFLQLAGVLDRQGERAKARAVYQQVLTVDAGNAQALAGLAMDDTVAPSPAAEVRPPPEPAAEEFVDLAALVIEPEPEAGTTRWVMEAEEPTGNESEDFARMLKEFKSRVARNLPRDDAKAHYDLGTAYREMGLLDEAVSEFQAALRASGDTLPSLEMLGQCFLDQGQPQVAIRTLDRALKLPYQVEDELLGIYYYLGRAHEETGNSQGAREFYEKVFSLDINFQDVTERLRALRAV